MLPIAYRWSSTSQGHKRKYNWIKYKAAFKKVDKNVKLSSWLCQEIALYDRIYFDGQSYLTVNHDDNIFFA